MREDRVDPSRPSRPHWPVLDGVRGVAVLMVMLFHFSAMRSPLHDPVGMFFTRAVGAGRTGVDLFFVLSGFLITGILLQSRGSAHGLRDFFIRRSLRILPLYYTFLIGVFVVAPHAIFPPLLAANAPWWYWTFLQDFGLTFFDLTGPNHLWSLAIEEHFYIVWPFLVFGLSRETLKKTLWWMLGGTVFCRCALVFFGYGTAYFTPGRLDALAVGALLALRAQEPGGLGALRETVGRWMPLAIVTSVALFLVLTGQKAAVSQIFKYSAQAFFYAALLVWSITGSSNHWAIRLLNSRWLCLTGKWSYGMYMLHPIAFILVSRHWAFGFFPALIAEFTATYAVAGLSWMALESPCLRLAARWRAKPVKKTSSSTGVSLAA